VDVALKEKPAALPQTGYSVSILVLVDVALKVNFQHDFSVDYIGFNPCFGGCRSESAKKRGEHKIPVGFNPCFGGCRSESHPFGHVRSAPDGHGFQSLFWWMSL